MLLILSLAALAALIGVPLLNTWEKLHALRETARAALAGAKTAIQCERGVKSEMNRATHEIARHERHVQTKINGDWLRSAHSRSRASGCKISHLGQSFPNIVAAGMYSSLADKISQGSDQVQKTIAAANAAIVAYNTVLRTFPGCLFVSFKPLDNLVHTAHNAGIGKIQRNRNHKQRFNKRTKNPSHNRKPRF